MNIYSLAPEAAKNIEERTLEGGFGWDGTMNVTFTGILIVFAMLVLLVVIILAFGGIMNAVNHKEKAPKAPKVKVEKKKIEKKVTPAPVASAPVTDDDEIIAVIAAAVNAMYEGSGKKPVIRAIRQSKQNSARSAWGFAGVFENTRAF